VIRSKRHDVLARLVKNLRDDDLVVAIFGDLSSELYELSDRPGNFYMRGGMGLASSIGLGLSLAVPNRVIVLDGDGSVLMNLGTFATMASESPTNLIHVIIDNASHAAVGGFPTATARGTDLAAMAKAAGIRSAETFKTPAQFERAFKRSISAKGPHVLVCKVELEVSTGKGQASRLVYIKERFMGRARKDNPNLREI
jgi:sulfopyruvate decarboxylase subunit beta